MSKNKMSSQSIGQRLVSGLTSAQTARLLDVVFTLWDASKMDKLLTKIDQDTAVTLSRLLKSNPEGSLGPVVSSEKYAEQWRQLWWDWNAVIMEVGDEEGEYVEQDADWEPPYFDGTAVAEDLEKIALRMLPMVEKVYASGIEEADVFSGAFEELEAAIDGYPEWMGAEESECYLEPTSTQCLFKWEWLLASDKPNPATTFVERIYDIKNTLKTVGWNRETFVDFFMELPEKSQKQIYDHLISHRDDARWERVLNSTYSSWSEIYQAYSASFNPQAYLDNCRRLLSQDWKYGQPLIDDALARKDHANAAKFLQQTLTGYVNRYRRKTEDWQPKKDLLITASIYYHPASKTEIIQLLKNWIEVADYLNQDERAAALRLQLVIYENPYRWDTVAQVFREQECKFPTLANHLIAIWQTYTQDASVSRHYEQSEDHQDSWLMWLLQAGLDQTKGESWWAPKMKDWLIHLCQNAVQFKEQGEWISMLTGDIAELSPLSKQYPNLLEQIQPVKYGQGELAASRRQWLKNMHGEQLVPALMDAWKQNVAALVPDPSAASKSNYNEHACWLGVVQELHPAAYQQILTHWQTTHKRRRNLWKALTKQGLT
ncbi:MAG: hypothetical protein ABFS45_22715 [Pseudomonadota bacterium]